MYKITQEINVKIDTLTTKFDILILKLAEIIL